MPGLKISEADRQRINPKFFCSKCDLLLIEPMQTPCGHLMCQSCVQIIFRLRNPSCPEDGTQLRVEDVIFHDTCIRRELRTLTLNCPKQDCNCFGLTYEEFQEHVERCLEVRERNAPNPREEERVDPQENDENE